MWNQTHCSSLGIHPSIHPSFSAYPIQDRGVTRDYSSYNGGQITNLSQEFICLFNLKNSASLPLTCQCHCSPALLLALLTPPPSLILPVGSGGEVYSLLTWFWVYHICRNKPRHPTLNVFCNYINFRCVIQPSQTHPSDHGNRGPAHLFLRTSKSEEI